MVENVLTQFTFQEGGLKNVIQTNKKRRKEKKNETEIGKKLIGHFVSSKHLHKSG